VFQLPGELSGQDAEGSRLVVNPQPAVERQNEQIIDLGHPADDRGDFFPRLKYEGVLSWILGARRSRVTRGEQDDCEAHPCRREH
jgi:hypothetical protein